MRKPSYPVLCLLGATLAVSSVACSFSVGTKRPVASAPPATAVPGTPAPAPTPGVRTIGRRTPSTPVTPVTPVIPTPNVGVPTLAGTNTFGTGTIDPAGWKGSFYNINAGTTRLPTLAGVTPNGILFAHELNVSNRAMTGGFPGIDPSRNENFALRWEAPLVVSTESDWTFRLLSDDGSILTIDGTPIIDNDGAHNAAEKSGPVHLVVGTHAIAVDYFQGTGAVALQLFCKKGTAAETICPTTLP
ncbi:MAG: putative large, multifunctional secreted protein [Labilithrix sp.]|nr:putative large, multifunctional secreted protein [Labilithrix sp.]